MAGNLTGQTLGNRYRVEERVGIGGMAEVYQGQDTVLGRKVAIKVMLPQYAEDSTFTARFRQEAASAANLQSPYIVNVYDWGQDSGTYYIIMEFVHGSDLKTAIQQRGAINQRKVAEIGSQVCQALAVAHGQDIIHRDIKPQNIMVQPDGNVKVMDFGIARAKNSVMAKTSAVLGTAHYISPEQAQGKTLTAASDIYSLGVVLYEAATGQLPFDGPDAVSVALKQVQEFPVPPRELNPAIDPTLEAIILKALQKDPQQRFATARDMRRVLNDFLAGRKVIIDGLDSATTAMLNPAIPDIPNVNNADQTAVMTNPVDPSRPKNYTADGAEPQKKGGKRALIIVGIIVAIAAIAGISYLVLGRGLFTNAAVNVPTVTGSTLEQATASLEEAGLTLGTVDYVYSDTVANGLVIGQTPRADTQQPKDTKVNLSVSQGIEQIKVPDLKDMTANEARAALQREGLTYEAGPAQHSDTVKENRVMSQTPEAGSVVDKGSKVTYILSAGEEQIPVPNVVNKMEGEATSELRNAGFEVIVDYAPDNVVPEGCVVSQSPAGGEKAKKSTTTVSIIVSTGIQYFAASAVVSDPAGGSVSPENTSVASGGSVTFYITPNDGYKISGVTDSAGNNYGASNSVTVNDVKSDVSLSVTFEKEPEPEPSSSASSSKTEKNNSSTKKSTSSSKKS